MRLDRYLSSLARAEICWVCGALLVIVRRRFYCGDCRRIRTHYWFERLPEIGR